MEATRVNEGYTGATALYMGMELSAGKWVLLFCPGDRRRSRVSVPAGDRDATAARIAAAKAKFGLPADAPVISCYEAGRDGFWIHRWLLSIGVRNRVVHPASIEVPQKARRVKTDHIDVEKLLGLLLRACAGERGVWDEVRVPTIEQEDHRRLHRERERLNKERNSLGNRITSLLVAQGLRLALDAKLPQAIEKVRCWDGAPLPRQLKEEIERMWARRQLICQQLRGLEQQRCRRLADQDEPSRQAKQLMTLRSIGINTSWLLSSELFSWREIKNRRQLGALAGMTPTPYNSGNSEREQGIGKDGLKRVRTQMVEIAWDWLRLQPDSELTKWYMRRFGTGSKRSKRIGIVAMARKLLVALWRYLHDGLIPAGARLKTA